MKSVDQGSNRQTQNTSAGRAWRMLPNDFPPVSTVRYYFYGWRDDGIFEMISRLLVAMARELHGKKPSPTAGVVDGQFIKTTESGGISGYDAPSQRCKHRLPGNGQENQRSQAPYCHRHARVYGWAGGA